MGHVNPVGICSCYDDAASAARKRFSWTIIGRTMSIFGLFVSSIPMGHMLADDGRVVSNFIVRALNGEDITVYGEGQQTRSFFYADDLIEYLSA